MVSVVEPHTKKQNVSPSAGFRWEWRSFGQHFGAAEERIAKYAPSDPHESDEIYFLTGGGDNVKVRDDLMDVKVLREVSADGLEQWAPVMKAPFPMPGADAAKVLEALRDPASRRPCGTIMTSTKLSRLSRVAAQQRPRHPRPQKACALHCRGLHGRAFRSHR